MTEQVGVGFLCDPMAKLRRAPSRMAQERQKRRYKRYRRPLARRALTGAYGRSQGPFRGCGDRRTGAGRRRTTPERDSEAPFEENERGADIPQPFEGSGAKS